jgi:hypothetical protein
MTGSAKQLNSRMQCASNRATRWVPQRREAIAMQAGKRASPSNSKENKKCRQPE